MDLTKSSIKLEGTPTPVETTDNNFVNEWKQPTEVKGSTVNTGDQQPSQPSEPTQQQPSATFDPKIPPAPDPPPPSQQPVITPKEDKALETMAKSAISFLDFCITEGTTAMLRRTLMNKQDRKALSELLRMKNKKVRTEYEEWIIEQEAKVVYHHDEYAPFSNAEKELLIEPFKPVIHEVLEKMKKKASPALALAMSISQVATPRVLPIGGAIANKRFNGKPSFSRATDVTNESTTTSNNSPADYPND